VAAGIVGSAEQHVFVGHFTPGLFKPIIPGGEHFLDRNAFHRGHQLVALLLVGRVQRDRQLEARLLRSQLSQSLGLAHGRDRDLARADAHLVVHGIERAQQIGLIEQRFAHAHHDRAGERTERASADVLLEDLVRREIAHQSQLSGGAERAADRAAHLRGDAQRRAALRLALFVEVERGHVHGLNARLRIGLCQRNAAAHLARGATARKADQQLGRSIARGLAREFAARKDRERACELFAQALRQGTHLLVLEQALGDDVLAQDPCVEGLSAERFHALAQLFAAQCEQ